jgi:hypothetical protein
MHARAQNLARYHVFYGDTNLINTELKRYQAVSREDLQRVAKKYLTDEGRYVLRYPVAAAPPAPGPEQKPPLGEPAKQPSPASKTEPVKVPSAGTPGGPAKPAGPGQK